MPSAIVSIPAPPDAVFEVLEDAEAYPRWVVGARRVRGVDGRWPEPGGEFHHTVGVGPVSTDDSTEVVDADPPHRLRLEVRFRPFGVAVVEVVVSEEPDGSRVTLGEVPIEGAARRWWNPLLSGATVVRNHMSLRRLRALVLERASGQPRSSS